VNLIHVKPGANVFLREQPLIVFVLNIEVEFNVKLSGPTHVTGIHVKMEELVGSHQVGVKEISSVCAGQASKAMFVK
jgi:hypothetical protein